ncbi:PVC-type heme-binding CxxCH protein [Rubinisphaera margarita]|uniref:PVC-type heme-binding CxxCH protein n=1 Tax=Rubinisphaera margarita TaxID=2909586 RepID=UPI001EE96750|nr:PVC-type heme-binding CxxCH protein [Rubinisphaera margarita]MCG6154735.1 c-type cytochrome [Rubinisphaera margarita]
MNHAPTLIASLVPVLLFHLLLLPAANAGPLEPEAALKEFELQEGYEISLAASEPAVIDPVHLTFDEQGRMWVVEMRDYPNGPGDGEEPKSRIKVLRDQDSDGVYESATIFADNLLFATSLLPWKNGVIVALSGSVEFMGDTDGDDKADSREVWLTGFTEENPQLRANHPTLGPDGWIYLANGIRGGKVEVAHPDWPKLKEPIDLRGKDLRFNPHTGECEAVAGNGQFGMSFDEFGYRLICSNRNPCMQVMFDYSHLERQPKLRISSLIHDVSPSAADSKLAPLTGNWTTSNLHQGQFTAACGVLSAQTAALAGPASKTAADAGVKNTFIYACDPTANLVHRDAIEFSGSTLAAENPHQEHEFLASRDEWFRPVNCKIGPDGSLYVLDMYRAVIEHPQFMPDELKQRPDLTLGNDRGRIWRIVRKGVNESDFSPETVNREQILSWLKSENDWEQQTAWRLLVAEKDPSVAGEVAKWIDAETSAQAMNSALQVLELFDKLNVKQLQAGLRHGDSRVRVQHLAAVSRLSSKTPFDLRATLRDDLLNCLRDPRGPVRFEAMLALQRIAPLKSNELSDVVNAVVEQGGDEWAVRAALLLCEESQLPEFLQFALRTSTKNSEVRLILLKESAGLLGIVNDSAGIDRLLVSLFESKNSTSVDDRATVLMGLGEGLRSRGQSLWKKLESVRTNAAVDGNLKAFVETLLTQARPGSDEGERLAAIQMFEYLGGTEIHTLLSDLIFDQTEAMNLRTAALRSLDGAGYHISQEESEELISLIRQETPLMRRELVDFCLGDTSRTIALLKTVQSGQLRFGEFAADQRTRLSRSRDEEIRKLFGELQASQTVASRESVLVAYRDVLTSATLDRPSAIRGKELFKQQCSICHQIGEEGVRVGPDISDTRTKRPDELLVSILDPNRAIDNNYFSYTAVTIDGKIATGILAEETPHSITLKQSKGTSLTLSRGDIEEFGSNGTSFMPQEFEKQVNPQQMVDLISFLKNWRYLADSVPFVDSTAAPAGQ